MKFYLTIFTIFFLCSFAHVQSVQAAGVSSCGKSSSNKSVRAIPQGWYGLYATNSGSSNRAERRSKKFKVNGGSNISIMQFLNVTGSGATGSSKPIAQLVLDRSNNGVGRNLKSGEYRVSIEQGNQYCGFTVTKGQYYSARAYINKNGYAEFVIGGKKCKKTTPNKAGVHSGNSGKYYYFKFGTYHAGGSTPGTSITWAQN